MWSVVDATRSICQSIASSSTSSGAAWFCFAARRRDADYYHYYWSTSRASPSTCRCRRSCRLFWARFVRMSSARARRASLTGHRQHRVLVTRHIFLSATLLLTTPPNNKADNRNDADHAHEHHNAHNNGHIINVIFQTDCANQQKKKKRKKDETRRKQ